MFGVWTHEITSDVKPDTSGKFRVSFRKQGPGKWLFFAFDGDKMIGHVNGIAWDRAPLKYKEYVEKTKAKYNLVGKKAGHVGIAVHKDYRQKGHR